MKAHRKRLNPEKKNQVFLPDHACPGQTEVSKERPDVSGP